MGTNDWRRELTLAASTLALACAASSFGGSAFAEASSDQAAKSSTLAEVVVTAERRPEKLQKVGVPATALSGADLKNKGALTVDSLPYISPSITVTDGGQGASINIRGIGKSDSTGLQNVSGVVPYWDGVAGFPGLFQNEPYYDIADLEVYRGPQGTFAGTAASGGAIFITTQNPQFDGVHGSVQLQGGNYNDAGFQGVLNVPVSDTLALRFAGNLERRDSFYHVTGNFTGDPGSLREGNGRFSALWQPDSALKVLFKVDYNYIDQGGYPESDSSNPLREDQPNPTDPFDVVSNVQNKALDRFVRTSLDVSYAFRNGITFRSISGYEYGITEEQLDLSLGNENVSAFNYPEQYFYDRFSELIYSQEFDLTSSNAGPLRWVTGLYYQLDTLNSPSSGFVNGAGSSTFQNPIFTLAYHAPRQAEAVFGQVTYDLTDKLQLQGGARYTWSDSKLTDNETFYEFNFPIFALPSNEDAKDGKLTWKVGANYNFDPDNMLYAFVATGHKASGINTTPVFPSTMPAPFKGEDVTDYEVGLKSTFFDHHIRTQIGGYYTDYQNYQVAYFDPVLQTALVDNVTGTTAIYGFEGQVQAVFGGLSADANLSLSHSRVGHWVKSDPCPGGFSLFGTNYGVLGPNPYCSFTGIPGPPIDVAGHQQAYSPDVTFNIGAQYVFHLGDGDTLTPRVDYAYTASQWTTLFELPVDQLPARNLVNVQLAYNRGSLGVTAYATNLFDLHYASIAGEGAGRLPGPPRQFGIRVSKSF